MYITPQHITIVYHFNNVLICIANISHQYLSTYHQHISSLQLFTNHHYNSSQTTTTIFHKSSLQLFTNHHYNSSQIITTTHHHTPITHKTQTAVDFSCLTPCPQPTSPSDRSTQGRLAGSSGGMKQMLVTHVLCKPSLQITHVPDF